MIINLKSLAGAISKINDMTALDKAIPGILLDVKDDHINVCYCNHQKSFLEKIDVEIEADEIRDRAVFDFKQLSGIIDACKPTGKIITNDIELKLASNGVAYINAEKKIVQETEDGEVERVVAKVNQSIPWISPNGSGVLRYKMLWTERYDLKMHMTQEEIDAKYAGEENKPLEQNEWEAQCDEWDISKLCSMLTGLATENGKILCILPDMHQGFVDNTNTVIRVPIRDNIQNRIIQSAQVAKMIASVVNKFNTEDKKVYVHTMSDNTVVFSTLDNRCMLSVQNVPKTNSIIGHARASIDKDYTGYMLNFNKEVIENIIGSAKAANKVEKADILISRFEEDGDQVVKLIITVKDTNKSTENTYDVEAEHFISSGELNGLTLNMSLEALYQAISMTSTEYIAFDINVGESNKTVRIAEIDLEAKGKLDELRKEEFNKSGSNGEFELSWSPEYTVEHRDDIVGYSTYLGSKG